MTKNNNSSPTSTPPTNKPTENAGPTGNPALQVRPGHQRQLTIFRRDYQLTPAQEKCLVALALHPRQLLSPTSLSTAISGHQILGRAHLATIISQLRNLAVPIVTLDRGYMLQMPPAEVSVLPYPPPQ